MNVHSWCAIAGVSYDGHGRVAAVVRMFHLDRVRTLTLEKKLWLAFMEAGPLSRALVGRLLKSPSGSIERRQETSRSDQEPIQARALLLSVVQIQRVKISH